MNKRLLTNLPDRMFAEIRRIFLSAKILFNKFVTFSLIKLSIKEKGEDKAQQRKEDLALVRQFKNGDKSAFNKLVQKYSQRVYNTILRMVKNQQQAEDLTQDAFLQAYKSLHKFREESSFYTWVYRIGVNKTLNFLKIKKRAIMSLDQEIEADRGKISREVADYTANPEDKLDQSEMQKVIEKAISALSEKNRVVFILKEVEGFSYEEISEMLGVTGQVVRTRIHRARRDLQESLKNLLVQTEV